MATVGLSFGAATSGKGFDVSATVTSILAIETAVETPWKAQLATLQSKDTALSGLGTNLSSLSTALSSLTHFDGVFATKQGSSSDTSVLALTAASSSAVAGSHTVVVSQLASTSSKFSDRLASANDTLSGNLTFTIGPGSTQTLTLDSTNNTLTTLAAAINSGSYGVTASIVQDTQGSRLSLVSRTSGAGGGITLGGTLTDSTSSTTVNFQTGQTGADAQLNVDGLDTTSASNTVSGAIPGVTFQLLKANAATTLQVQITNDNSSIETAVQSFATAYNAIVTAIKTQEGKDSTGKAEPLFGDPTLALVQNRLSAALLGGSASGSIGSLDKLGLSLGTDGTLTFTASTLETSLNAHFNDVAGFFQSTGSFGLTLQTTLNQLGSSSTQGSISLALAENSTIETGINKNISDLEARAAIDKTRLTSQLTLANQILQAIPQQLNEINQIYSALTGYNTGTQ